MRIGAVPSTNWMIFLSQACALAKANLKCRYRKTVAGFLWVFLNPLITFTVQAVAFGHFLKIDVQNYLLFLVSGLLPWMFIAQTLEMAAGTIVNSGGLIKAVPVSPLVFLMAQVLDNAVNFLAAFVLILAIGAGIERQMSFVWMLLVLPSVSLLLGVYALSQILATLQVFFRDTRFLVSFGLQACFFLTPIFYPREMIPAPLQWSVELNPFYRLVSPFQILIHNYDAGRFSQSLLLSFLTTGALLVAAVLLWQRRKHLVYHYV